MASNGYIYNPSNEDVGPKGEPYYTRVEAKRKFATKDGIYGLVSGKLNSTGPATFTGPLTVSGDLTTSEQILEYAITNELPANNKPCGILGKYSYLSSTYYPGLIFDPASRTTYLVDTTAALKPTIASTTADLQASVGKIYCGDITSGNILMGSGTTLTFFSMYAMSSSGTNFDSSGNLRWNGNALDGTPWNIITHGGSTVFQVQNKKTAGGSIVKTFNNTLDDGVGNMIVKNAALNINCANPILTSAATPLLVFKTKFDDPDPNRANKTRWTFRFAGNESGTANVGGDLQLLSSTDDGTTVLATAFIATRSTGDMMFAGNVTVVSGKDLTMNPGGAGKFTTGTGAVSLNGDTTCNNRLTRSGNISANFPTNAGQFLTIQSATFTDTTATPGNASTVCAANWIGVPTWSTLGNVAATYAYAANLFIAGAPAAGTNVTLTNRYAIYTEVGASYFGDTLQLANNFSRSRPAWGTSGIMLLCGGVTYTDTSTTTTAANAVINSMAQCTIDGNVGATITNASTLYIAGAPIKGTNLTAITNSYSIYVAGSDCRFSGSVAVGATNTITSAILNCASTTKGFLPPVMTTAQKNAIAAPPAGLEVYDSTLNNKSIYNGTAWVTVSAFGGSVLPTFNTISCATAGLGDSIAAAPAGGWVATVNAVGTNIKTQKVSQFEFSIFPNAAADLYSIQTPSFGTIAAGVYELSWQTSTNTSYGRVNVTENNTSLSIASLVDCYSTTAIGVKQKHYFTWATTGPLSIKFTVSGKNASSTDFNFFLYNQVSLTRVA